MCVHGAEHVGGGGDQLPIEKTLEAPVWCLPAAIWLSSGAQLICDAEKASARHI